MKRRKYYMSQYQTVEVTKNGRTRREARYTGVYYRFDHTRGEIKRLKAVFVSAALLCLALFALPGLWDSPSLRKLYVALPYVGILLPVGYLLGDAFQFCFLKQPFTERQRDVFLTRLPACALAAAGLAGATLLAQGLFALFNPQGFAFLAELPLLLCSAALSGGAVAFYFAAKKLRCAQSGAPLAG